MKKLALIGILAILSATGAWAQETSPTPPKQDDVVRITTTLIQIDATVTDKKGNVVTDLTADDFEVYENGELQKVTNFSFFKLDPQKNTGEGGLVKPDKNAPNAPLVPMRLRPEEVRRTFALVVDDLGLSFGSLNAVRDALRKFIDQQMQPGDMVAIVRTSSGMGALQQFTSDKQLLYAAIDRIKFKLNGRRLNLSAFDPIRPTAKQDFNSGMSYGDRLDGDTKGSQSLGTKEDERFEIDLNQFDEDVFAVGTLGAFNYVIRTMNELPGRKAAILFSEGFELYSLTSSGAKETNPRILDSIRDLAERANRSSVVVYTVDPRGLVAPGADAGDVIVGLRGDPNVVTDALRAREDKLSSTQQSLEYLARETGGFSYLNQNDISYGLGKVMDDQKGYYLLGYQPDSDTFDEKKRRYNKLEIKLKRPDLKIRYRNGFFGVAEKDAKTVPITSEGEILNALASPFTKNDIDLKLTTFFVDRPFVGSVIETMVHIDIDNLKFTEQPEGWQKVAFEVLAVVFGENGEVVEMVNRSDSIRVKGPGIDEVRKNGLVYTLAVPVKKPGGYQMRFVIRDTENKKLGSASQYIEIPDLKKKRLTLSGIALRGFQPEEIINASQKGNQLDVTLRQFRPGSKLQFVFDIYNAKAKSSLTTRFKLFRDNREVFASAETPLTAADQNGAPLNAGGALTIDKKMPPGEYILQVLVKDSANSKNQFAAQWIDFEVVP